MPESPRRLVICLLLTAAGLAGCSSPAADGNTPIVVSVAPSDGTPSAASPSTEPASPSAEPTSTVTFAQDPPPTTSAAPTPEDRALPLTLSRTGGIAGVQDQVRISPDGTATVTGRTGKATTTHLSTADLAALRRLVTDPALAREAGAADGAGTCADGFQYDLRTPVLSMKTTDCGRSTRPTLAKIVSLVLPPGGK